MPKYQCPECEAVLRRAEAVAPGKKIRCPKCEAVFAAHPMPDDEPAAEPAVGYALAGAPVKAKPPEEDEENSNPYKVIKESDDHVSPEIHLGSLRDKFAKSKIGPAMFKTVLPSNWLLRLGLISCIAATISFIYGLFPIVFCEATPLRPFIRPRVDMMGWATLKFAFGAVMCIGASKMHDLTSYTWAMIGSIMALLIYIPSGILTAMEYLIVWGPLGLLPALFVMALSCLGFWGLITLFNPLVREGFRERAEEIAY
jgi:hypothetical protein